MENERIVLKFKEPKIVTVEFAGSEIQVKPYISQSEQTVLINEYIGDYFFSENDMIGVSKYNHVYAEYKLNLNMLYYTTNLDVEKIDDELIYSSDLMSVITEKIKNHHSFKDSLWHVIEDVKAQLHNEQEIGTVIDKVASQISVFLSEFSKLDAKELLSTGQTLLKEMEESKIAPIFEEVKIQNVEKAIRKSKKKEV